jgi:hypothetical protein
MCSIVFSKGVAHPSLGAGYHTLPVEQSSRRKQINGPPKLHCLLYQHLAIPPIPPAIP